MKMSTPPADVTDVVVPASKLMSTAPLNRAATYTSLDGPKSTPMPSTFSSPPAPLPQTTAPVEVLINTTKASQSDPEVIVAIEPAPSKSIVPL